MRKINLDKRTIFQIIIYSIVIIELAFFIPVQLKRYIHLFSRTGKLNKKIVQFNKDVSLESKYQEDKNIMETEIKGALDKIINEKDIAAVISYISKEAKVNSVEISQISPEKKQIYKSISDGEIFYLPIELDIKANYHNLAKFINALEKGKYFLAVKDLSIIYSTEALSAKLILVGLVKG